MDEVDTLLKSVLSEAHKNVRKEDNNKRSREKRRAEGSTGVRVSSFFIHSVSGLPSKKQSIQAPNNAPRSKSPAEAPINNFENIEIVQLCPPSLTSI